MLFRSGEREIGIASMWVYSGGGGRVCLFECVRECGFMGRERGPEIVEGIADIQINKSKTSK